MKIKYTTDPAGRAILKIRGKVIVKRASIAELLAMVASGAIKIEPKKGK